MYHKSREKAVSDSAQGQEIPSSESGRYSGSLLPHLISPLFHKGTVSFSILLSSLGSDSFHCILGIKHLEELFLLRSGRTGDICAELRAIAPLEE
jgi:hypothetical protein